MVRLNGSLLTHACLSGHNRLYLSLQTPRHSEIAKDGGLFSCLLRNLNPVTKNPVTKFQRESIPDRFVGA